MLTQELLTKIKLLEIHTRRALSGAQVGDYSTAIKGSGFEFDQIRPYQEGDDVRFIDWNSSARMNDLLVRQYLEERNRTILLLVDASQSTRFGSTEIFKSELIAQVASVLAIAGDYAKDCVGLMIFGAQMELSLAPKRSRGHAHRIMQAVFECVPTDKKGSLNGALEHLLKTVRKKVLVFVISDFLDEGFEKNLGIAARRFDLVAIRCLDAVEKKFPARSLVTVKDPEGEESVELSMCTNVATLNTLLLNRLEAQNGMFKKYGIDLLDLTPGSSFMRDLILFFRRRMMY
jgi:uncharacterized protein (DUF58 family)